MASDTAAEQIKQLQAEIAQLKRENANLTALNRRAESCDRADAAMYRVKHQGKHGYCFYQPSK